jgi:hypothetical protein
MERTKKILDQLDKREKIYKELTSKYKDIYIYIYYIYIYIYEYRSRLQTFITQKMIQSEAIQCEDSLIPP